MTNLIKWKASQTELKDVSGQCYDFDAVTKITEFDISNCTFQVDGHWGSWSTASCSVPCGSGEEYRKRICNNPSPSNGGKYCVGNDIELSQCNLGDCPESCKHDKNTEKKSDKSLQKTRTWLGILISDFDLTSTKK
ncbi:A disintegrin and metalloproteinase with thrombospondin motifs 1-like [Mytilus californianus]|uniref:A disintegrin and metalloproteinase with thrombospondin motifs 1-like n=1 Tax=Mytilus californianus TaxID=6549 RepID=UPI002245A414|nr:A disintegrin and metalloproteinase with thrombospondin motifs 1-like [Mytilus californianus]